MSSEYIITADRRQIVGRRRRQEDSVGGGLAADESVFFVLADGMGGYDGGDKASQAAVMAFTQAMENAVDIKKALYAANAYIAYLKEQHKLPVSAGCTLVAVCVTGGMCQGISVGDSYIFLQKQSGELEQLNRLHNQGAELDALAESGKITAQQALESPQRNALTSAVTGAAFRMVDILTPFELHAGERLVLLSDGFLTWGKEALEHTLQQVSTGQPKAPQELVVKILKEVEAVGHPNQDNTSVIIVQATPIGHDEQANRFTGFDASDDYNIHFQKRLYVGLATAFLACLMCIVILVAKGLHDSESKPTPEEEKAAATVQASSYNLSSNQLKPEHISVDKQAANTWKRLYERVSRSNEEVMRDIVQNRAEWGHLKNVKGSEELRYEDLRNVFMRFQECAEDSSMGLNPSDVQFIQRHIFLGMLYRAAECREERESFQDFVLSHSYLDTFFAQLISDSKDNEESLKQLESYIDYCGKLNHEKFGRHFHALYGVQGVEKLKNGKEIRKKLEALLLSVVGYKSAEDAVRTVKWAKEYGSIWPDLLALMQKHLPEDPKKRKLFAQLKEEECKDFVVSLAGIYSQLGGSPQKAYAELTPHMADAPMEMVKRNAVLIYSELNAKQRRWFAGWLLYDMAPKDARLTLAELIEVLKKSSPSKAEAIMVALSVVIEERGVCNIVPKLLTSHSGKQNNKDKMEICKLVIKIRDESKNSLVRDVCRIFTIACYSDAEHFKGEQGTWETYPFNRLREKNLEVEKVKSLYNHVVARMEDEMNELQSMGSQGELKRYPEEIYKSVSARYEDIERWYQSTSMGRKPDASSPEEAKKQTEPQTPQVQPAPIQQPASGQV